MDDFSKLDELLKDAKVRSKNTAQIVAYAKEQYPELSTKQIQDWISSKATKQLRGNKQWNSFVPYQPRQEFQMDVATMSKTQRAQDMYMLVAFDPFTKYIFAEPMDSKKPSETAKALQVIVKKMDIPAAVVTDLGGEFQNDFEEELEYYDIQHIRFRTHVNGVERAIRTIKDRLRQNLGLGYDKENAFFDMVDWAPELPHVLHEINHNTANRITGKEPQDVVDEYKDADLEDQEVLRKHSMSRMEKHAQFKANHVPLQASEEDGSLVKVRMVQSGPNSIGRQTYGTTTYRVIAEKRTGDGPMYKLKVHAEDPDNKEDTRQIINNPTLRGPEPRFFPRHELMKVVDTRRSDKLAPFTNEEYENRAMLAEAKDKFVEILQTLKEKKRKNGSLVYPTGKIALSDPTLTKWKKDYNIKISMGVFVKTFRDLFKLEESYVIMRDQPKAVASIERPRAEVSSLSAKQQDMRQKLESYKDKLVDLLKDGPLRVSSTVVKDWFESVAQHIKTKLKDRQSGITKLSSALELYPDKFQLTENRTLITLL